MPEEDLNLDIKSRSRRQSTAWLLFNICWGLAMTVAGYAYLELSEPLFRHVSPWYLWLLATVAPFLVSQATIFWLILSLLFHRRKNTGAVILISALIFAGLILLMVINVLRGLPSLKT